MTDNIINLYDLFIKNKHKKIYKLIKKNPKLIYYIIDNNQTLLHFIIKTNKIKLLEKILKLDYNILITCDNNNMFFMYYALFNNLYDLFFYLMDLSIEKFDNNIIFNTSFKNSQLKITNYIIINCDLTIIKKYFTKYYKFIDWTYTIGTKSYITELIILFYDNLDYINELLIQLKKININFDYFNKSEILSYILNLYYKPNNIILLNNKLINSYIVNNLNLQLIKDFIQIIPQQLNKEDLYGKCPFHIIASMNDLDLLVFSYNHNANFNYFDIDGTYNFCSYAMDTCNENIIEYLLNLNIEFNIKDEYNETPIFNLLRNPNNISHKYISLLLIKTNDWDSQNIYGQTIIHLLLNKKDIEIYYDTLKNKYFDINIKNKYGLTCIDIYKFNLKSNGLLDNDIKKKIFELKNLIIYNFYNKLTVNNADILHNINIKCNDPNTSQCKDILLEYISKPLYTDIDKLSSDYQQLFINDYKDVKYSLYNTRFHDIYIYILIFLEKFDLLGIPFNKIDIDLNKKFDISSLNYDNLYVLQHFAKYFITRIDENNNIYSFNIYFKYPSYYLIPYNLIENTIYTIETGKKFILIIITIMNVNLHSNILLVDVYNNRIIRFEPHGGHNKYEFLDLKLEELFLNNIFFKNYKYYKPNNYIPLNSFQNISHEIKYYNTIQGDIGGFCTAWCLWFIETYIININNGLLSNNKFNNLILKIIKKLINNNIMISNYIRNYANYLHNKLTVYYINIGIPYDRIYRDNFNSKELDIIFTHINNKFNIN